MRRSFEAQRGAMKTLYYMVEALCSTSRGSMKLHKNIQVSSKAFPNLKLVLFLS